MIYFLDFIGIILFFRWIRYQIKDYNNIPIKRDFFTFKRFKSILITLLIIIIPLLVINFTPLEEINHLRQETLQKNIYWYAIVVSFFISLIWMIYVISLDIFDKEKKRHLFLVFVLSCVFTLVTEFPYHFIHSLGFTNGNTVLQNILYSVFGIGLIEETVKLLPLLILLKFTKAIDEPYDYILYASCSALGFAFVENAMYLYTYGIEIINARALYASVAHMTFSSMIGYGLFLIKFKRTKYHPALVFSLFFFLAIFSHGFYDFWLINPYLSKLTWLTTLFFLATVHIWFSMKNNTINTSNFYDTSKTVDNDKLKTYLIISLLSIFMFSYIYVAFVWNSYEANIFFVKSLLVYGYIIFYLIATLSRFDLVEGFLKPFKWSYRLLIPSGKN